MEHVTHVKINDQHYFEVDKAEVREGQGILGNLVYVRMKPLRYDREKREWVEVTKELRWVEGTGEAGGFNKSRLTWNAWWRDRSTEDAEAFKRHNETES